MEYRMKLPRNKLEFTLFLAVISIISVNIIAPLITCYEVGFHMEVWASTLKSLPFIWIAVIASVLITYRPAEWLTDRILKGDQSFHARIITNILCTVFLMSILLTVAGTWIGTRRISMEPIHMFFYKWPRNAAISFFVEACIAQPIARFVMLKMHERKDRKSEQQLVR